MTAGTGKVSGPNEVKRDAVETENASTRGPHAALADAVMENIRGTQVAKDTVALIARGVSDPDSLLDALQSVLSTSSPTRLRGFVRQVQKELETRL